MLIVWDFRFHGTQESLECRHPSRTLFVWRLNIDLKVKALDILGIFEREKREKKEHLQAETHKRSDGWREKYWKLVLVFPFLDLPKEAFSCCDPNLHPRFVGDKLAAQEWFSKEKSGGRKGGGNKTRENSGRNNVPCLGMSSPKWITSGGEWKKD